MSLFVCRGNGNNVHCYDDKTRKPCTGLCGHTVCLECVSRCYYACPFCKRKKAFNEVSLSVNYNAIALTEDCRERFWEEWTAWVDKKTPDAGFCLKLFKEAQLLCSMCVEPAEIPRICLTCDEETLFKENPLEWKYSVNAIIPTFLQRVMCSDCALNTHGEKKHDIVDPRRNKKTRSSVAMVFVQKVFDTLKDIIENKKGVSNCFVRRRKFEMIGRELLSLYGDLTYDEELECGYLGDLIRNELIKRWFADLDKKLLDLFGIEGNSVCECSTYTSDQEFVGKGLDYATQWSKVYESGCPFSLWKYEVDVHKKYSISEKEFSGDAATTPPNEINCPLCVYKGYSQHQRKDFLLKSGVSVIEEICKTELIPLDKCCLKCLDYSEDCNRFLTPCNHHFKISKKAFTMEYREKKRIKDRERCFQNCFMKNSSFRNFVIIDGMMDSNNLLEVIMYEIEQTDGFVDCQLRKVRMKETVRELYNGLESVYLWDYFDYWSKPIETEALFKSFKQQWNSFLFGNGKQKDASQCKCTVIWNKISKNKLMWEKYGDLGIKMIDMARYSMTEEIHGCPMEYKHGIELNKNIIEEIMKTVDFESTGKERESTLAGNEWNKWVQYLMSRLASNICPFAHLYCQNEEQQLFDNEAHLPYTGACGHTICKRCVEKATTKDCPVCGKNGSFRLNVGLVREIGTIRRDAWEIFKAFWNREAAESGACSKCNKSSFDLYICYKGDWAMERIVTIENVDDYFSHYVSFPRVKNIADVLRLSRQLLCKECASAQTYETEEIDHHDCWKNCLKKANGLFLLELLEDETGGGVNCEHRQVAIQNNRKLLIKVLEELIYVGKDHCGYDTRFIKVKLIGKLIKCIDQCTNQLSMLNENPSHHIEEKYCPLCVMIDYLDCANNRSEQNWSNWMNVFEHLWGNQSLRFEQCCIRCLQYLNNRFKNGLCQTELKVERIRKMSNAISEGIEKGQVIRFQQAWANRQCKYFHKIDDIEERRYSILGEGCNDRDNNEIWQNLILREYFFCLLEIITVGLSETTFPCHLRKIRIHNLAFHFLSEVCDTWYMYTQDSIIGWQFLKTSTILENLKIQFTKLKSEMNKEDIEVKCECTGIWERSQKMMKKIGHKDCEEKRKYHDLEDSMEEMARFSLEVDLDGCPMQYDHGIVLDEESLKKLKESTDSEQEKNKNKCLCVQIDSIEPNTAISSADVEHAVSFFINWWKHEALYSHLICHVCVERLELIRNRLKTLPGFYNCELRKMRMLKTFGKLTEFIQNFRTSKGRVPEEDFEEMQKVFDNFISQWNLFQFGSDSDQQFSKTETVCHCTKTLETSRAFQNSKYSDILKYEHKSLMRVSEKLAEFKLTEIISGCPLDFDHNINVDCFERSESTSSEQSCSSSDDQTKIL